MKRLKIVTSTWHVMHFWDLFNALSDIADFYLINNMWRSWRKKEFQAARPIPKNTFFVPFYEEGKYDLAILDIDQQCVNDKIGKSLVFKELNARITDIPKVVINHGSPVYPEFLLQPGMTKRDAELECIRIIKDMVGDSLMVTNSYEAASEREWGWGYPIWHGMEPSEWMDLPKEPRIFTALSVAGCEEYYNRDLLAEVMRRTRQNFGYDIYWAKKNVDTGGSPEEYKEFLGRSLIYLDVSFRTPMNRARTEAMLSGACIVQVKGAHDLDREVAGGKLGDFMIQVENNPAEISKTLTDMIENRYDETVAMGQRGKEMAIKTFSRQRYGDDWKRLMTDKLNIQL